MLDVSRHFFTVPQVEKIIEVMAAYKLNNFHWHLTDGQGWRIEIKQYPKLTQVGGYRMQTMFGSNRDFYFPDQLSLRRFLYAGWDPWGCKICRRPVYKCYPRKGDACAFRRGTAGLSRIQVRYHTAGKPAARGVNSIYCPTEATFTFLENVLTGSNTPFPQQVYPATVAMRPTSSHGTKSAFLSEFNEGKRHEGWEGTAKLFYRAG